MKFSTGKRTRVKHSTGMDMKELEKLKRRMKNVKHSSGLSSPMKHTTGQVTDAKSLYDHLEADVEKMEEEEKKLKEREKEQK